MCPHNAKCPEKKVKSNLHGTNRDDKILPEIHPQGGSKATSQVTRVAREKTRTNWPRKVRELILDSDSRAQGVKGYAFRVPGGQRVGFHGRRGSRGRPKRTQQVKG